MMCREILYTLRNFSPEMKHMIIRSETYIKLNKSGNGTASYGFHLILIYKAKKKISPSGAKNFYRDDNNKGCWTGDKCKNCVVLSNVRQ